MLAVTARRFRSESIGALAGLVALGVLALVTGRMMNAEFHSSGLARCLVTPGADCDGARDAFGRRFDSLQILTVPLVVLPALLGAFVGAPLVAREVEAGTHRFAWTQGITRGRWLAWMASGAIALGVLTGAAYAAIAAPWLDVPNQVTGERFGRMYDLQGILPIAVSAFAVAAGVACGVLLRRTLPAMAATIGVFVLVRLIVASQLRPRFAAPVTADIAGFEPDAPSRIEGAWVLSRETLTADGVVLGRDGGLNLSNIGGRCPDLRLEPGSFPDQGSVDRCLDALGAHQLTRYHPASRFWTFQLVESGIYVALAAGALLLAARILPRRTA